jgi:hypothetical protein
MAAFAARTVSMFNNFTSFGVQEPMTAEWAHHFIFSASEICRLGHEFTFTFGA